MGTAAGIVTAACAKITVWPQVKVPVNEKAQVKSGEVYRTAIAIILCARMRRMSLTHIAKRSLTLTAAKSMQAETQRL